MRTGPSGKLVVESGPHLLDVVDWSLGGLAVSRLPEDLRTAGEGTVRVSVEVEDTWIAFVTRVHVVRPSQPGADPDAPAALDFVGLPSSGAEILHALSEAARTGEPPRLSAVLERVDPSAVSIRTSGAAPAPTAVPGPPGPDKPRPKGTDAAGPWRPPLKMIFYVLIGLLLAIYLGTALYERVWRIEVDAASLVAPTARIVSPADGLLRELRVTLGDRVTAGASLFLVESPTVQAALDRATLEVGQAQARVAELEAARAAQVERLAIHGRMMRSRVAEKANQLSLLQERLGLADARVERLGGLVGEGVSALDVDAVRAERAALAGELSATRSLLAVEEGRLGAARDGYYFDGDGIEEGLPEADAALAAARAELALRQAELDRQQVRADIAQSGRAPFSGRVSQVLQVAGAPVRQGNLVVVLEQEDAVRVEAWITRHEAEYVRLGAQARVSVAGLGRAYDATVRSVDSNPTASEAMAKAGEQPRLQVVLDLDGYVGAPETAAEARADLREVDAIGLPVVVSFARSWR